MSPIPFRPSALRRSLQALALGLLFAAAAQAQAVALDLPAQPLDQSLNALARASGTQIVFITDLARGVRAPALKGGLGVREALDRLLAGSGLVVRTQDARTFTVERAAAGAGAGAATVLREVLVRSDREERGYNAPSTASGTKTEALLRDVPQTIDVVPQQLIRDQGITSIEGALRNIPGIGLSHGDGQRDQVSIRGFTSIGDQFVDGFRDDALYFRDLSNTERVEVIKGPAAVLYGRGSSGGLVNRVTRKPGIHVSDVALSVGSWADKRGEFDLGRVVNEAWSWRLTGAAEDANSYRSQQFLQRQTIAPSVTWKPDGATMLMLQADYLRDKRVTDFGVPAYRGRPVAVDPSTYYGAANARDADYSESKVGSFTATFTHRFSDSLRVRNALRYYHYDLDRQNTLPACATTASARRPTTACPARPTWSAATPPGARAPAWSGRPMPSSRTTRPSAGPTSRRPRCSRCPAPMPRSSPRRRPTWRSAPSSSCWMAAPTPRPRCSSSSAPTSRAATRRARRC